MTANTPDLPDLLAAMDATWAPLRMFTEGGWTFREGAGGGKRVSAATAVAAHPDPAFAETRMRKMGQTPLFMLGEQGGALDTALAARGYRIVDPVTLYMAPVATLLATGGPGFRAVIGDLLMPVMAEIWAGGGIGPGRLAVMDRVAVPKAYLLTRTSDAPGGVAFVAADRGIAMIHAIEVRPELRRQGLARLLLAAAAEWAAENGCTRLALAVTDANTGANALYVGLGMVPVGHYHYRQAPE
ncbi:GNAT family N-acetyltransferase [Halovulum dunhuangense]|uniref:GNAT family N-acetyltransferase n=1 Tax=Halovulum dunhuangense TaxID=1505036 RepID=A0A849KZ31_9RHOB|nr:GNAT family N-acetyltransferase [Halovulum dunhuangense]NNU79182.1 GNAT family N-acetyltransferase [Halovulum dunhuangense]